MISDLAHPRFAQPRKIIGIINPRSVTGGGPAAIAEFIHVERRESEQVVGMRVVLSVGQALI